MLFFQIKNDVEAEVLCMTAIGNIKLQQGNMEETKVQFTCTYSTLYFIIFEFDTCEQINSLHVSHNKIILHVCIVTFVKFSQSILLFCTLCGSPGNVINSQLSSCTSY